MLSKSAGRSAPEILVISGTSFAAIVAESSLKSRVSLKVKLYCVLSNLLMLIVREPNLLYSETAIYPDSRNTRIVPTSPRKSRIFNMYFLAATASVTKRRLRKWLMLFPPRKYFRKVPSPYFPRRPSHNPRGNFPPKRAFFRAEGTFRCGKAVLCR